MPRLHSCLIKMETISVYLRFPELRNQLGLNNSFRKQPTFRDPTTGFPRNDVWETRTEISYWWRVTTCLVPTRLSLDENVNAKEGGKETTGDPSHRLLRFLTSHSRFALASTTRKTKRLRRKLVHYLDLGSAYNWSKQISIAAWPIRSTDWTSFGGVTSGDVGKCRVLSQATDVINWGGAWWDWVELHYGIALGDKSVPEQKHITNFMKRGFLLSTTFVFNILILVMSLD